MKIIINEDIGLSFDNVYIKKTNYKNGNIHLKLYDRNLISHENTDYTEIEDSEICDATMNSSKIQPDEIILNTPKYTFLKQLFESYSLGTNTKKKIQKDNIFYPIYKINEIEINKHCLP